MPGPSQESSNGPIKRVHRQAKHIWVGVTITFLSHPTPFNLPLLIVHRAARVVRPFDTDALILVGRVVEQMEWATATPCRTSTEHRATMLQGSMYIPNLQGRGLGFLSVPPKQAPVSGRELSNLARPLHWGLSFETMRFSIRSTAAPREVVLILQLPPRSLYRPLINSSCRTLPFQRAKRARRPLLTPVPNMATLRPLMRALSTRPLRWRESSKDDTCR